MRLLSRSCIIVFAMADSGLKLRVWAILKFLGNLVCCSSGLLFGVWGTKLAEHLPDYVDPEKHAALALIVIGVLGTQALLFTLSKVRRDWTGAQEAEEEAFKDRAREVLVELLRDLLREGHPKSYQISVNVFLKVMDRGTEVQKMKAHIRLGDVRPDGVRWTKDKGVIGLCWQQGRDVSKNLKAKLWSYRDREEKGWYRLSGTTRFGLSLEDMRNTRDVEYVAASPILVGEGRVYVGCVSVDGPTELEGSYEKWKDHLRDAANRIGTLKNWS